MYGKITVFTYITLLKIADGLWNKSNEDYCRMSEEHTMCQYTKFNSMRLQCSEYQEVPQDIIAPWILDAHNTYRNRYANGSTRLFTVPNELELEWDDELAAIAARWAWQCPYYEDDFRDVERFRVANSVAILSDENAFQPSVAVWDSMLRDNETFHEATSSDNSGERVALKSRFSLDERTSLVTNPYFKYLGCASAKYLHRIGKDVRRKTIIVCNYGPLESPYPTNQPSGQPCTQCPDNTSCVDGRTTPNFPYKSLCRAKRIVAENPKEIPDNSLRAMDEIDTPNLEKVQSATTDEGNEKIGRSPKNTRNDESSQRPTTGGRLDSCSDEIMKYIQQIKDSPRSTDTVPEMEQIPSKKPSPGYASNVLTYFDEDEDNVKRQYRGMENKTARECGIVCDNGEEHTMCKYNDEGPRGYMVIPLSARMIKKQALRFHNKFRNKFAGGFITKTTPLAANMREMIWNERLEKMANRWAKQCVPEKDKCRDTFLYKHDKIPTYISQLAGSMTWNIKLEFPRFARFFNQWRKGLEYLTEDVIEPYRDPKNGSLNNYADVAQILWADTYQIGCSMTLCSDASKDLLTQNSMVIAVCNYGPGGLIEGNSVYEKGGPCTRCKTLPTGGYGGMFCSKEYPFLCSGGNRLTWNLLVLSIAISYANGYV